ncbi:serine/threonine-protein kinase [Mangrovihabitans endophyticus]|uniref:non-specific serine/threonine protein kinase n=1 Tax=Mangrovihabitans endophyticus TaxID=1751298 RepID=A0A8J3BZ82_9ACTN|nr:serine/threonine-protein kinase [Mangrovihabitans endophyticus]GGK95667.1 hypothetical protein GCM10012284_32270 [Mangrovihabitans endophyticus]
MNELGRYRLVDRLGSGGMSVVWRAHDEVLDRDVAIKVLRPETRADPELVRRIGAEARAAARLRHPNVVAVHDYGTTDTGLPYVVMELVDGRPLAQVLADGPLPWPTATRLCGEVASALAAAHAAGVVHRDVKPGNVMVAADGVKLVDFGISAAPGDAEGTDGEVYGTPAYLAPERLEAGIVRPATDVYALGLLMYLTLVGRLPWKASSTTEMLTAHRYLEPAALPDIPGLPDGVADLCRRCVAKDPADRPGAAEAAHVLREIARGAPSAAPAAAVTDTTPLPEGGELTLVVPPHQDAAAGTGTSGSGGVAGIPRRRRRMVAAMAAALLPLAGAAAWFTTRPAATPAEAEASTPRPCATRGATVTAELALDTDNCPTSPPPSTTPATPARAVAVTRAATPAGTGAAPATTRNASTARNATARKPVGGTARKPGKPKKPAKAMSKALKKALKDSRTKKRGTHHRTPRRHRGR